MTSEDKMIDTSLSNSLADLAARIRSEHEAVSSALKDSSGTPSQQANC